MRTFAIMIAFLAALVWEPTASAQSGWTPQASGTTNDLLGINVPAPGGRLIAVGRLGTIVVSTDGGMSWGSVPAATEAEFRSVCSYVPDSAIIFGGECMRIWWDSFDQIHLDTVAGSQRGVRDGTVQGSGRLVEIAGDSGLLAQSTNRGLSWRQAPGIPPVNYHALSFIDQTNGYAAGDSGTILRFSISLAMTRQTVPWYRAGESILDIGFEGVNQATGVATGGYAVGTNGTILTTSNGGTIWTGSPSGSFATLRGLFVAPLTGTLFTKGSAWVVGDSGTILYTNDFGAHWLRQESGTNENLYGITMRDSVHGVVVGAGGTVLTTGTAGLLVPEFVFVPSGWDITGVPVGTSKRVAMLVRNPGSDTLHISGANSSAGDAAVAPATAEIAPGAAAIFTLTYTPVAEGWEYATVTFIDDARGSPHTGTFRLSAIREPAASGWRWQNPLPHGHSMGALHFITPEKGIAVGEAGTVMRTTDGGAHWNTTPFAGGVEAGLAGLSYRDDGHVFACGSSGTIIRSTDGGETWVPQESRSAIHFASISFADDDIGYAVGAAFDPNFCELCVVDWAAIHRTTNGGMTWEMVYGERSGNIYDVAAFDSGIAVAVAAGDYGTVPVILRTADRGDHWVRITNFAHPPGTNPGIFVTGSFTPGGVGIVGGTSGDIWRSSDKGLTWSDVGNTGVSIVKLRFIDSTYAVGAGLSGEMIATTDGGLTWTSPGIQFPDYPVAYEFIDHARGFLSTFHVVFRPNMAPRLWSTADGGAHWLNTGTESTRQYLSGVAFADPSNGYAVGDSGTIVGTTNGGATWRSLFSGTLFQAAGIRLLDVAAPAPAAAIAVGENGAIIGTTDGGATWAGRTSNTTEQLNAIAFGSVNDGVTVGNNGTILITTDGGATWTGRSGATAPNLTAVSCDGASIAIAGSAGTMLLSTNGGAVWTIPAFPGTADITGLTLSGADIIACTGTGQIFHSPNWGASWSVASHGDAEYFTGISSFGRRCIASSISGKLLVSRDRGDSWELLEGSGGQALWAVTLIDSLNAVAVGSGGTILATATGGEPVTAVPGNERGGLPRAFALGDNYPNPFNPVTTIGYSIPEAKRITLKVYDLLGREVAVLFDGEKKPGTYTAAWNAGNAASGIYFCRMTAGEFTAVRKLVLMK